MTETPESERGPAAPPDAVIRAWARLVRVSGALLAAVERDLRAGGHPPLAWYDALLELERAGAEGLRPAALEERMLLAQYSVSRLVERMERAGLVRRSPDPEDGRAQRIVPTAAGRATRARMWPAYRDAIARHFASHLAPGEAAALGAILDRLGPAPR